MTPAQKQKQRKYEQATKNGTAFKDRKTASADFKSKNAAKLDPKTGDYKSSYTKEPTKRPEHIPQSYKNDSGQTVNVNYNAQYGGYGSMVGGSWMAYSVASDIVMMNMLMGNHGYHIGGPPVHGTVVASHNPMAWVGSVLVLVLIIFVFAMVFS